MSTDIVMEAAAQASRELDEADEYGYDDGYSRVTLEEAIEHLPLTHPFDSLDDMQKELLTLYTPEQVKAWCWRRKRRITDRHALAKEVSALIGWRLNSMFPKVRDYVTGRSITNWVREGAQEVSNRELEYQTEMGRFELMNDYTEAKKVAIKVLLDIEKLLDDDDLKPREKAQFLELYLQAGRDLKDASAEVAKFEGHNRDVTKIAIDQRVSGSVTHALEPATEGFSQLMQQARAIEAGSAPELAAAEYPIDVEVLSETVEPVEAPTRRSAVREGDR